MAQNPPPSDESVLVFLARVEQRILVAINEIGRMIRVTDQTVADDFAAINTELDAISADVDALIAQANATPGVPQAFVDQLNGVKAKTDALNVKATPAPAPAPAPPAGAVP